MGNPEICKRRIVIKEQRDRASRSCFLKQVSQNNSIDTSNVVVLFFKTMFKNTLLMQ